MPEVNFRMTIENAEYIRRITEAKQSEQELHDLRKENNKASAEGITDLEASILSLRDKQKKLNDELTKTGKTGYNAELRKITENLHDLEGQYGKTGKAVSGASGKTGIFSKAMAGLGKMIKGVVKIFSSMGGVLAIVTAAFGIFKALLDNSVAATNKLRDGIKQAQSVLKLFGKTIVDSNVKLKDFIKNAKEAAKRTKEFEQGQRYIAARTTQTSQTIDRLNVKIAEYRDILEDVNISDKERQGILDEIYNAELQIASERKRLAKETLDQSLKNAKLEVGFDRQKLEQLAALAPEYEKHYDDILEYQKRVARNQYTGEFSSEVKELAKTFKDFSKDEVKALEVANGALHEYNQTVVDEFGVTKEIVKKEKKGYDEISAAIKKAEDELTALFASLQYEQASPTERIQLELQAALKSVNDLETVLKKRGALTTEQEKQLVDIRAFYMAQAQADTAAYYAEELEKQKAYDAQLRQELETTAEQVRDIQRQTQEEALALAPEKSQLALQLSFMEEDIGELSAKLIAGKGDEVDEALYGFMVERYKNLKKQQEILAKQFSVWDLLDPKGELSDDQRQAIVGAFQETVNNVVNILGNMYAQRVADAERSRGLLDEQIAFTTDALNAEIELMKAGYANNVDAKKKELEELQKQREKAIAEEEKALKAQQAFDSMLQLTSLITASAQIFKELSAIPIVGIPLAIASIASMFAAFAAAKIQAKAAARLAEGGVGTDVGIIAGKSHTEGGEPFLKHVEVERGEMWGVLSKPASRKYGKEFAQIVTSFNKDNLAIDRPTMPENYINVDVNQTNERLDRVQGELIKLNKHFGKDTQVIDMPTAVIQRKNNRTRIIRKNV